MNKHLDIIKEAMERSEEFANMVRDLAGINNDLFINEAKIEALAETAKQYI